MLKNLLKISFRTIAKDKTYSILNITGLTIGITCSYLQPLSFDVYTA
jgi:putative ABC transport system permease protein